MIKLSNKNKGIILYTLGMLVTVLLNIFVKKTIVVFKLPTIEVLCIRQFILVLCLIPFMIKMKFNFFDKKTLKPNLIRNILFSIGTFLLYQGMSTVPLNEATAITFLTPIIASFLSIKLLKEKSSKSLWISLILSVIGMLIIKTPSLSENKEILYGYGFLLFAVVIRGYVNVLNRKLAKKFDTYILLFYTHIIMFLTSLFFFPQFVKFPPEAIKYIFITCVLFFIEYYLLFKAYKNCNASSLQPFEFTKLIFMMIFSNIFLGELTTINQIIGGIIILSGYVFVFLNKKNKSKKI